MTATDELRAMLDERGVEWTEPKRIWWELIDCEPDDSVTIVDGVTIEAATDGTLVVYPLTAEQAIAATLGAGTCHDLAETPAFRDKTKFKCSECGYEYSAVGGFGCDFGDEPDFNYCPNCGRKVVRE